MRRLAQTSKAFLALLDEPSVWKSRVRLGLWELPLPPFTQPRDYVLIVAGKGRLPGHAFYPAMCPCSFCKCWLILSQLEHSTFLNGHVRVCHGCLAECNTPGSRTHGYIVTRDRVRTLYGLTEDERNEAHWASFKIGGPCCLWAGELEYLAKRKHGREGERKWAKRREPPSREQPERATKRAKKDM
jgi:hypothetical protein